MTFVRGCDRRNIGPNLEPTPLVNLAGDACVNGTALRSLFDQEESALLRYAFSLVGRREVAEEIVQEVFLQLHARWDDVAEPAAWLFRSVRNQAFKHARIRLRELLDANGAAAHSDAGAAKTMHDSPEAQMQLLEAIGALRSILSELSDGDRQLVTLKYFENLRYREISQRTGLSIGNVGYRLHHILKELAHKLRRLGIDEDL
jgi:RNA polymerase sigma factor (sigma-70 family)